MLKLYDSGVYLLHGRQVVSDAQEAAKRTGKPVSKEEAAKGTIAYGILKAHNKSGDMDHLQMRFDSLTSMILPTWALSRRPGPPG